ncbi:TetR/AcrR family transcriptional regulator [Dasania marina]|uniref:TetR/AcrR family transcriptional regulator n=1 Tax=Dasania marina TaxID=471499 RepID=UPI0030DC0BA2|tara:strand:+ start:24825 stop:25466 length:642 start_codon:yes stop_codon:yes gene_type:complete
MSTSPEKTSYHHGELYNSLLNAAHSMLAEGGIEALSLRKLAEQVGVSRTAPYHHFKDKNELLCALAADGFQRKQAAIEQLSLNSTPSAASNPAQQFKDFVYDYIKHATANPELYDLMFGRPIWKTGSSNPQLQNHAYPVFQQQLALIKNWQQQGVLDSEADTLRLSQVIWSTLHGITRLVIDGIYQNNDSDQKHIKAMCDCAISQFLKAAPLI